MKYFILVPHRLPAELREEWQVEEIKRGKRKYEYTGNISPYDSIIVGDHDLHTVIMITNKDDWQDYMSVYSKACSETYQTFHQQWRILYLLKDIGYREGWLKQEEEAE